MQWVVSWLLELYILARSKVISGWTLICDSAHSWWFNSAAPLGNQAPGTMTRNPTQSHYLNMELTSSCSILLVPYARLGSDKYQFYEPLISLDREPISRTLGPHSTDSVTAPDIQCDRYSVGRVWRWCKTRKVINNLPFHNLMTEDSFELLEEPQLCKLSSKWYCQHLPVQKYRMCSSYPLES